MAQLFANNAFGVLAGAVNGAAGTLVLVSGHGARFPAPAGADYFLATLAALDSNGAESAWEIVRCTARSTDQLTVVRAQEGTTATSWNAGTRIEVRWTKAGADGKENAGAATSALSAHVAETDPHQQYATDADLNAKQPTLVSGSNIKTVNGTSLLGSGNVDTGTANGLKSATTTVLVSSAAAPTAGQVLTATSPTAATWQAAAAGSSLARTTRTSNTALGVADKGNLIFASASYVQSISVASSLGAGWWCLLRVDVGHETTLNPATGLIDGQSTAVLRPGQTYLLTCTGSAFTLDRLGFGGYTEVLTSGTSWTCPGGVRTIKVTCVGGGGGASTGANVPGGGGGTAIKTVSTTPGTSYAYGIGALGSSSGSPAAGGNTVWGTIVGGGGLIFASGSAGGGGATGGDINVAGSTAKDSGGNGGSSLFGFGATPGISGVGYGSGSCSQSGSATAGKAGAIIIEY